MKKTILIGLLFFGSLSVCQSQEWMTSLDVAKSLAFVQDKLLFVIWEDVSYQEFHVIVKKENGTPEVVNLFENEILNEIIWEHFVPVIISEHNYQALFNEIKGKRSQLYIDKFNDDTIKIMDINGQIINTTLEYYDYLDIAEFIAKYALNTSFLKEELAFYREQQDFNSAYHLASQYADFSVHVNDDVKPEIVKLSNYYLSEAEGFIANDNSVILKQKIELQKIKQALVLGKAKKVLRQLKRIDSAKVDASNEALFAFLNFTAYILLKDETNASIWRSKVSLVNLKKANLIVKNNS
ncbi:hypothetical protein [Psychroserpens sp.]|uniref:hypothetical protein n=1 Tax=Psychroserpens sp. TaxID=2020870 RepID=UPI002B274807|nr:hypothetical protein [Psychroserpens sp.]